MSTVKIGVIREGKLPPDKRVPLTPKQCKLVADKYNHLEIHVQSSEVRSFSDGEYRAEGLKVVDDLADCDILFGVKEVPVKDLIANKTYFFFSHTIKEQSYNRDLLRAILEKKIRLIDYETLTRPSGGRLIGFGRYAGIVGTYNGLLAYGAKEKSFDLKPAFKCRDRVELEGELEKVSLSNIKITLSGGGRVAGGAIEILEKVGVRRVQVQEFLQESFNEPVYAQLNPLDYNKRIDGSEADLGDFFDHPAEYESNFMRFAEVSDLFIAGHYWDADAPFLFTREDANKENFNIKVVADISCDIDGPVASTIRPSTIESPLYGYDPRSQSEVAFDADGAITVMAVDNLPCELPRDASEDFGDELIKSILDPLLMSDDEAIIERATITREGELTELYSYLKDYVEGK